MSKRVIVTGGAGYIGAHICVALLEADKDVLVIDNFDNSDPEALRRIETITGKSIKFVEATLGKQEDDARILKAAKDFGADSAIHLAGLKSVGESVSEPIRYYETNMTATFALLRTMESIGATTLVFSSSCTVYGDKNQNPVDERGSTIPTSPYGRSKLFIEDMLRDHFAANSCWSIANLRYFNPAGAHPSGLIGEAPNGHPNHLFPFISQVAVGKREMLSIFGNDYPTPDGTAIRDYIHVSDVANGHLNALDYLAKASDGCCQNINLGTGTGYSVLQAVAAFQRASNRHIPYEMAPRRAGDVAEVYAEPGLAKDILGWQAKKTLEDMCADTWAWQRSNPDGYRES